MTDHTPGYTIKALGIHNPAGLVLKHKLDELGIVRKQLAEDIGCRQNYLSIMTSQENRGPSFATHLGEALVAEIAKAEHAKSHFLSEVERKNPKRRKQQLMEAMTILSLYSVGSRHSEDSHLLFAKIAEMVPYRTYRLALTLVGEAIQGKINDDKHLRTKTSSFWAQRSVFEARVMSRRAAGETLHSIDSDPMRDEILDEKVRRLAQDGQLKAAMDRALQRYEGISEERYEQNLASM